MQRRIAPARQSLHRPGGILALDLAGTIGWAYGGVDDAQPLTNALFLPAGDPGGRFAAAENSIIDLLDQHRPLMVAIEAPMRLYAQAGRGMKGDGVRRGNEAAARQQYGLHAMALSTCWRHRQTIEPSPRVAEADVGPVRQAVLGRSKWADHSQVKPWIVAWCQAMGFPVVDHNSADACVLWQFTCDKLRVQGHRLLKAAA